ncbi:uncharacterized protein LOC111352043 isoform X3 [Spodoptera litura]|uniref:Uncharacterized protein LOC111352043 isoform X3 n=1 Tax=Spodoptera litura TaxID=69820 RepID=A0A9J7DXM6_SPOLT|nr:uncharacterized protein LOC111352043 isoform X3 [Spodoptera litura]
MFGIYSSLTRLLKRHEHQLSKILKESWEFIINLKTLVATIWFMFLYYLFSIFEMQRSISLEKINDTEVVANARNTALRHNSPDVVIPQRRRFKPSGSIFEQYCITIKPKLYRSSSLSELTPQSSDFTLDYFKSRVKAGNRRRESYFNSCGDNNVNICAHHTDTLMSWNFKGKKPKKKQEMSPESYASKFAVDYINSYQAEDADPNASSCADNSSVDSTEHLGVQKGAAFPFKSTPSGNLKVQSNQVVFQSSTVGVLLADPTQAKVKVKIEGKAGGEPDDEISQNFDQEDDLEPQLQFGPRETLNANMQTKTVMLTDRSGKMKPPPEVREKEDKGKDLGSLGYTMGEPIDWMRVQLPKKQDLFQEFYRRINNYINTDTVIHIGDEEFHCHYIVLQVYSSFFDMNPHREIELPIANVTPEAFQTIYEWMIFNGVESNKMLKRDNILDLFYAAQYLAIKDLEDQCWSFIVNENLFSEDTAFALFREARKKGMTPVMDLMVPRVMRFFLPLVASKDFIHLEPEELMVFLKSNYISVTSEIEVLMAGVRWLYGDWSARRQYAVDVMRCVRFGLISPWQLVDIKRNPDNAEILEIVNEPEVQQMVDDGLAYVIIKYWYGNNSKNYYHWIDVLGLTEPAERNWIGEEKNHVTYKDFLQYLEQFMVPKDQMYQQMAMMQPLRRNDDNIPGTMRGMDTDKIEMRRPKMDFPLPATLKGLAGDKDKSFPTMSEFFENRRKQNQEGQQSMSPSNRSPSMEVDMAMHMPILAESRMRGPELACKHQKQFEEQRKQKELQKQQELAQQQQRRKQIQQIHMCSVETDAVSNKQEQIYEPPEKDSAEDLNTTNSETSSGTAETSIADKNQYAMRRTEKRHSVAASYLAAATAALAGSRSPTSGSRPSPPANASRSEATPRPNAPMSQNNIGSPQISLFNQSKESLAKTNMNKLSTSILGPSNKNYIAEGSLFNWDRETVLVFGGIDHLTTYGFGGNIGKYIYRFDPVTNVWDYVGDLPEPRHHHSVAFLRGRVYLVGGADPRDDDIRGKSAVVSTVWSFEPVSRSWFSESGLMTPRKNFGLVVHRMAMYAIGGLDKKGRVLRSVEKFDPKTGSWSEVRSMSVCRMALACAKYREYIWVAGGMTGEKKKPVCKIVECYNSTTNEWTEIHSLRFPRCFSTMFAMNDKLYIVGGAGKVSDKEQTVTSVGAIDVWDWKLRKWRQETEMSMPRHGHALAYLGTQLIIIGGVTTIYMRALNNVESFCCERGAWIRGVATLPSPLSGHGAVTLPPASLM